MGKLLVNMLEKREVTFTNQKCCASKRNVFERLVSEFQMPTSIIRWYEMKKPKKQTNRVSPMQNINAVMCAQCT